MNEPDADAHFEGLPARFESVTGEAVTIRPIVLADAPRLQHLFTTLSPESIYRRFFAQRRQLSDAEARELATVDYRTSLALGATLDDAPDALVGVARFAPTDERAGAVEMAIIVGDAYQGHGIGRRLFAELARVARQGGHRWMLVETQADNQPMIDLAEHAGYSTERETSDAFAQIWLDLQSQPPN